MPLVWDRDTSGGMKAESYILLSGFFTRWKLRNWNNVLPTKMKLCQFIAQCLALNNKTAFGH